MYLPPFLFLVLFLVIFHEGYSKNYLFRKLIIVGPPRTGQNGCCLFFVTYFLNLFSTNPRISGQRVVISYPRGKINDFILDVCKFGVRSFVNKCRISNHWNCCCIHRKFKHNDFQSYTLVKKKLLCNLSAHVQILWII